MNLKAMQCFISLLLDLCDGYLRVQLLPENNQAKSQAFPVPVIDA